MAMRQKDHTDHSMSMPLRVYGCILPRPWVEILYNLALTTHSLEGTMTLVHVQTILVETIKKYLWAKLDT